MNPRRSTGLQTIFSFFLGLMVTAFVGVGVYTFHAPPEQLDPRIEELNRDVQAIRNSSAPNDLTRADREEMQRLTDERNALIDARKAAREDWGRSTSIILIAFATLTMAISLVRADGLPVISNGLLLGGLFSMVYGVGWIIATDNSLARFVVITVALAITLALGYVRFVRRQTGAATAVVRGGAGGEALEGLEERLRDLEARVDEAASVLRPRD